MPVVVSLDLEFSPDAAISAPLVLQRDGFVLLSFNAVDTNVAPPEDLGRAVIEFIHPVLTRFGYPDDEAREGHPLYAAGMDTCGGFEVLESSWKDDIEYQNDIDEQDDIDDQDDIDLPDSPGRDIRHYAFAFSNSMFECLAEGFRLRSIEGPDTTIFSQALRDW